MTPEPSDDVRLPLLRVMSAFSAADICDGLWWKFDDGELRLFAIVNDVFAWGTADLEEITPERIPVLEQALDDLLTIGDHGVELPDLYAARVRGMRPQDAAYPEHSEVRALFDACGPERPRDMLNPGPWHKPTPAAPSAQETPDERDIGSPDGPTSTAVSDALVDAYREAYAKACGIDDETAVRAALAAVLPYVQQQERRRAENLALRYLAPPPGADPIKRVQNFMDAIKGDDHG